MCRWFGILCGIFLRTIASVSISGGAEELVVKILPIQTIDK